MWGAQAQTGCYCSFLHTRLTSAQTEERAAPPATGWLRLPGLPSPWWVLASPRGLLSGDTRAGAAQAGPSPLCFVPPTLFSCPGSGLGQLRGRLREASEPLPAQASGLGPATSTFASGPVCPSSQPALVCRGSWGLFHRSCHLWLSAVVGEGSREAPRPSRGLAPSVAWSGVSALTGALPVPCPLSSVPARSSPRLPYLSLHLSQ